jgi:TonB family protein
VQEVSKDERTVHTINGEPLTTAVFAPSPVYPFHARLQRLEGRGMFEMRLRPDGTVSAVAVLRSTGMAELDRAAAAALIRWRFPAQTTKRIHAIRSPVNFVMMNRLRGGTIHDR